MLPLPVVDASRSVCVGMRPGLLATATSLEKAELRKATIDNVTRYLRRGAGATRRSLVTCGLEADHPFVEKRRACPQLLSICPHFQYDASRVHVC